MPKRDPRSKDENMEWLGEELANLAFVAERAGFKLTARDLNYALRSFEVEQRERPASDR
ncbi:MAG: hypothetical protein QNI90_11840 [Dinoroseobacter sp.]|nr:hypothetical protein [Dinoroseobacter sp.]